MPKVDVNKAAKSLDCHPETVRRLCRSGKLDAVKVGRDWRISKKNGEIVLSNRKAK